MAARRSASEKKKRGQGRETQKRLAAISGYLADPSAGEFDRLVYERVRLGIMSALAVNQFLSFSELKDLLRTSDGNLSTHARKLEEAGYIRCRKAFEGRVPKTRYELTAKGKQALGKYLDHMEALIKAMRNRPRRVTEATGILFTSPSSWTEMVAGLTPGVFRERPVTSRELRPSGES